MALARDMQKCTFVTTEIEFSMILSDASLDSLTFSVLLHQIVCIVEKDLEFFFIQL